MNITSYPRENAHGGFFPLHEARSNCRFVPLRAVKQRGVVLFFTLVALLIMSLAAVALVRSVDTGTLITANLAFKQAATASGDTGVDAAVTWLAGIEAANATKNVLNDGTHAFNNTDKANGYYSNFDPNLAIAWNDNDSKLVGVDAGGNERRYIIQRLCRFENTPVQAASCLFGGTPKPSGDDAGVPYPESLCTGICPVQGLAPELRITVRVRGMRDSVSSVQTFAY